MEYAIGTTHVMNGPSLISSVMDETPLYHPAPSLWDITNPTYTAPGGEEPTPSK